MRALLTLRARQKLFLVQILSTKLSYSPETELGPVPQPAVLSSRRRGELFRHQGWRRIKCGRFDF